MESHSVGLGVRMEGGLSIWPGWAVALATLQTPHSHACWWGGRRRRGDDPLADIARLPHPSAARPCVVVGCAAPRLPARGRARGHQSEREVVVAEVASPSRYHWRILALGGGLPEPFGSVGAVAASAAAARRLFALFFLPFFSRLRFPASIRAAAWWVAQGSQVRARSMWRRASSLPCA